MYLLLFIPLFTKLTIGLDIQSKTLYGNIDDIGKSSKTNILDAPSDSAPYNGEIRRKRREVESSSSGVVTKANYLYVSQKQLMVHWVGENSKVIICLARDPASIVPDVPSAVFISYDDGDTYQNKTESFNLPDGGYATLERFYSHAKLGAHFVFTDIKHNAIYVTTDYGKTFERRDLNFTPSEISFHGLNPSIFVLLDKNTTKHKLWITEDSGKSFRMVEESVKAFYWLKEANDQYRLVVQRSEPNDLSTILLSMNLFKNRESQIYISNVTDFFIKGDYLFSTKYNEKGELQLYVSYKLGAQLLCIFDSKEKFKSYFIVDVTNTKALVAAGHSNTTSHLYVSESLAGNGKEVKFTLSLEDLFVFFPSTTWQDTWLHHKSEQAFADVYKVEGLTGIYIASRVTSKPVGAHLGPQHLGSVITFDHGTTWRLIQPPALNAEGQWSGCVTRRNCSLHLSQKFNQLLPDTRSVGILSSKSAPGFIMATGVLGENLKNQYGIYISSDGGVTWRQTLRELYFFNMGDHGGILSAAKYYKTNEETRHIEYSTDEGRSWYQTEFNNEKLRLYGLMTEPGKNTTLFTIFGSLPEYHQWIIVKVDFAKVFERKCTKDDYNMWSPSHSEDIRNYIPCEMGLQVAYQRRMPLAKCLNGLDYIQLKSTVVCECDLLDFECDSGFARVGSPPRCIRDKSSSLDVYRVPAPCKPGNFYNRTKGYRKIAADSCVGGFESHYLPDIVPCPFHEEDDFLLFAQRENIFKYNLIRNNLEQLAVPNLKNAVAIDFDIADNCVYWSDLTDKNIGRRCFVNGNATEILVSDDIISVEGIAFDWISKTLYFVDSVRAKIGLIRTNTNHNGRMRRTILNSTVLTKPRGIVVHPSQGYMFWTDWFPHAPSVNRANLDGSSNMTLFGRDKVQTPNGIAIDYFANRLYWIDAGLDYIGSSDLHGDGFVKVVSNTDVVSHPFAIAVFKDNLYWDDWRLHSIFSSDKENFNGAQVILKERKSLMGLKVVQHGIQIGTNACANTTCPYICVGLPKNRAACLCPDGLTMNNGKCVCPGNLEPLANFTCPSVAPTCAPSLFMCGDGRCLPNGFRCDGDFDCIDGSDEGNCPLPNCPEGSFQCENGRCIHSSWRCDGEHDCGDRSDEKNCTDGKPIICKFYEFHCNSGAVSCIPAVWRCDGEADCTDRSDESSCSNNTCNDSQFSCGIPSNRCISKNWVCDGEKDCIDGRDEANCTLNGRNETCLDWMFQCKDQHCIPFWWKCDGNNDCEDNSDEEGCSSPPNSPIDNTTSQRPLERCNGSNEYRCATGDCILASWVCDGQADCPDETDELSCDDKLPDGSGTPNCTFGMFPCNETCYPLSLVCDGKIDCKDGYDEKNCSTIGAAHPPIDNPTSHRPNATCESNEYQCNTGNCILTAWLCDGDADCIGGEDEKKCETSVNCSRSEFKCQIYGSCIPATAVCDGHFDCPDKTDELSCDDNLPDGPGAPSCSFGMFPCDETCYPLYLLCDGKYDCKDRYDERDCSAKARVYQINQMEVDERFTNASTIYINWWIVRPTGLELEYQPSIKKIGDEHWRNESWIGQPYYQFTNLQPFTKYNMTVYVRIKNTHVVFPPAIYNVSSTSESIPSEPWNVSARQRNGSHILISWNKPRSPNGLIVSYELCWIYPNSAEIRLKLSGNETSHMLSQDFDNGLNYTFWVIARNRKFESKKSLPATLMFDGTSNIEGVKNIKVKEEDDTISLTWDYSKEVEGFDVRVFTDRPYPNLPPRTTSTKNITLKLAPGVNYKVGINAFKKDLVGPTSYISFRRAGNSLPEIESLQVIVLKDIGTAVKLRWDRPKYAKKLNWMYGVYYGINHQQLFESARNTTINESITITNLDSCENYVFSVGLVGPIGFGPLSGNIQQVSTSENPRAPPKRLIVEEDGNDPLQMKISWIPPCPSRQPVFYKLLITEKSTTQTYFRKADGSHANSYVFKVLHGGIYEVKVATDEPNAIYSKAVKYFAPAISPPVELRVGAINNGSYVVDWKDEDLPQNIGKYRYEVFVHDGNKLNESSAQKFIVDGPPFVYTNASAKMYTFAVRIKTSKGLNSQMSHSLSLENLNVQAPQNMTAVIVPSVLVIIALLAVVAFLVVRNKKIQNSFTRFTNSHYDTRSEAATFDDNNLEEDDSPHIRGFADDEPLVLA
ncbi:sortilin-related receptor-like isoform X9 [Diabrotica virgifera virgifera]|uniref:Sortilin-related receptor n=1 Tax=Diabrotica virgifera virgifera TaxID=50390 RepID=A0ABM5K1T9_DIAVI|nr:sortilin-related receptor-like isoform X9 [Diabrotica virgifera virgifera]